MLLAGAIFVLTIVLVIWQPKGLGIDWSAMLCAGLALISGVVHVGDIPVVWNIVWNATATFIAVIIISLLLDESGFFEWAALHVSRWGNGRGRLLFTYIVLLGAAVAALFANDGAALILTPIVIAMLLALGFSKGTTLAFVMAAGFIADTASLPLIVSNLVNIVSADFFGLGFTEYASVMVPVDIAAIIATLVMLHLFFRKDIPPTYDLALLKAPAKAIKDLATFRTGWIVLILLLVGFFVLEPLGIPVSAIAAVGAVILFAVAKRGHVINTGKVLRGAPWQKPCLSPVAVWQMLLTRLLEQHYGLTLDDTAFSDETVIKEHIDAGITLADAVNFLVDKYELVRIDRRGFSWQEQSPYLRAVDILRARRAIGLLRRSINDAVL